MKEAIGSYWIINIVLFFMILMISYIGITMNYTRTLRVKNAIISVLEEYGTSDALVQSECKMNFLGTEINCQNFLKEQGYEYSDIDIKPIPSEISFAKACKFNVAVPLDIVIPVINERLPIEVKGTTRTIYNGTGDCGTDVNRGE